MRLLNDIYLSGLLVPKENLVFGVAESKDEPLEIKISSTRIIISFFL